MSKKLPILLRLIAMGSRFSYIFILARLLPPEELGSYSVFAAYLGYAALAAGFDFYTYSNRFLVSSSNADRVIAFKSQLIFFGFSYMIVIPIVLLIAPEQTFSLTTLLWFLAILPTEHFSLEVERALVSFADQKAASILIFIRQGVPTVVAVGLMMSNDSLRSLQTVFGVWLVFNAISLGLGIAFLSKHVKRDPTVRASLPWIRNGIRIAIPFLLGTLCLRGLFTFDRHFVSTLASPETLGAYGLFMGIAAGVTQLSYTGIHQFQYPMLISTFKSGDVRKFTKTYKRMFRNTYVLCFGMLLLISVSAPFVGLLFDAQIYSDLWWLLPAVTLTIVIYNLSLVPHYALYAMGLDRSILFVTVSSFAIFLLAIFFLKSSTGYLSVVIALALACSVMLIGKTVVFQKSKLKAQNGLT